MAGLRRLWPGLRLFVTGEGPYIESLARDEGLGDVMIGRGWLPYEAYNQYLSACDAFALPLRDIPRNQGRWPHKLGDYLLLGRPVIATSVGDVGTLFRRYRLGLLCDGSSDGYKEALEQLLDDVDRQRWCQDAALVAREVLDLGHRVSIMETLYGDTVAARRAR
jgi:glycosyltransferase involved in cell wall biosynthesis